LKKEDEQKKKREGQKQTEEGSPGTGARKRKRTEGSGSSSYRMGCDSQLGQQSVGRSQRSLRVSKRNSSFLFGGIGRVGAWQLGGELDKPEGSSRRERTTEGKGNDIRQKGELRQWSRNRLSPALPPSSGYSSNVVFFFSGCSLSLS
jgi:hypothetical protein